MSDVRTPPFTPPFTIVCDLDGTLVDSAPDICGTLDEVFDEHGLPRVPFDEARLLVGHGALALVRRGLERATGGAEAAARHDEGALLERFLDIYAGRLTRESPCYPGVPETLRALADDGHRIAVCTNKPDRFARRTLAELQLDQWIAPEAIVGGDTFAWRKPDRRAYEAAVAGAGGERARSVLVGDSRTDVETARNADVPSILVTYGYRSEPVEELAPDFAIDEFGALAGIVRDLLR